jgi:hypothetical protein
LIEKQSEAYPLRGHEVYSLKNEEEVAKAIENDTVNYISL